MIFETVICLPIDRQAIVFGPGLGNASSQHMAVAAHAKGIDLLRQMRSVLPDIPFLMLTGRGDLDSVAEAKSCGVTAYIRKPFSPANLEIKLRVINSKL